MAVDRWLETDVSISMFTVKNLGYQLKDKWTEMQLDREVNQRCINQLVGGVEINTTISVLLSHVCKFDFSSQINYENLSCSVGSIWSRLMIYDISVVFYELIIYPQ